MREEQEEGYGDVRDLAGSERVVITRKVGDSGMGELFQRYTCL